MPFTNYAAQAIAWMIGSNLPNFQIQNYAIGIGSGTPDVTNVTLVTETGLRVAITGSANFSEVRKVSFQGDYNSVQMSGVQLTEFGLFTGSTSSVGSTWFREAFSEVTFDGTNELQINTTIEILPG